LPKSANPKVCLRCLVMTSSQVRIQTSSLFVLKDGVKFKYLGRCEHSLNLIIMSSDETGSLGLFTAGLQPLQASVV